MSNTHRMKLAKAIVNERKVFVVAGAGHRDVRVRRLVGRRGNDFFTWQHRSPPPEIISSVPLFVRSRSDQAENVEKYAPLKLYADV